MSSTADDRPPPPPLHLESIPSIDLRLLSQSELYSLSLCSASSFDLHRRDDVVIPKINRSVFNESAGSRKQTYSRLRLAPRESAATTTTTIHRRTPHLRSTHTPHSNNVNDPEQAENSQIIATLKQLFKSDPNFEDLVSIEEENSFDLIAPDLDHETLAIKRKRGRPRKHENLIFLRPPAGKRFRNNAVKKIVVYDDEKDVEVLNHRGVEVSLDILAGLEDPFGPEIRRRTEGMSSEDELLGFLRGLNGQWGSRRKKRRVVDASEFGDALPKAWKLSLCIKKKEGRVWLYCRRYLSPSGRQFESCKEISTYLLSFTGGRSLDKPTQAHYNYSDDFALKGASGKAADLILQEDTKRESAVHNSSPPPPSPSPPKSLPTHHEKQVTFDIEDSIDRQVGELFKCLKCSMIFEGKDDLLDHQVLAHGTERSQLGTSVTDWVVVEAGTFECHICHETFSERNQYNVHVGAHVKCEIKNTEASQAPTAEMDVDPASMTGPDKESPASVLAEGNVMAETWDAHSGDKLRPASPHSNCKTSSGSESRMDELVHDLNVVAHGKQDGRVNINGNILVEESCDKPDNKCTINDEILETGRASDVVVPQSYFCLGHEASLSTNESNGKPETSGGTHIDGADHRSEGNFVQRISSGSFPLSSYPNEQMGSASGDGKDVVGMSASFEVLNQDSISETRVTHDGCPDDKSERILEQERSFGCCVLSTFPNEQTGSASGVGKDVMGVSTNNKVLNHALSEIGVLESSICEKKGFGTNRDDMHKSSTSDELTSEKEKVVAAESSSRIFHRRIGLDEDGVTEAEKLSTSASHSLDLPSTNAVNSINNVSIKSSKKQESPQKEGFGSSTLIPSVHKIAHDTDNNANRLSSGLESSRLDGQFEVGSNAFDSYGASSMEGVSTFMEESNFKSCSSLSPWQEEEYVSKSIGNNVSIPTMEVQPGCEENCHIENNVERVSLNKAEEANDDFQIIRNSEPNNNESVAPLGSSQNGNTGVLDFNTRNNLEFCSLVPSGNEQTFGFQDEVTCLYNSAMEECKQESSERGLLNQFYIADTSDDIFENKMYSTPLDGLKFDEDRDIGSHELSLAFRNSHALYADTIDVEQKKDLVNCSLVPSKIKETFDVQTNLSMVNNSMVDDLKAGRDSMGRLFSLSCNNATSGFRGNANTAYPGRAWEGLKSDEFRISENKKFMSGFGSNHSQPNEEIVPSGMWKTGASSQLQSGLTNPSHPQIQSPSCFHSFDIMSEKAEDGLFRLDERYNDGLGVSGLRSGRSEPVEFSFLTGRSEHNPNALQGDPRVFSYNSEMEQDFDSSFWLGKNAMMPSMAGRNQVTSVCAWCRNEFHLQPLHSGTQAGIGSLCPACSAGISGHVNML